MTFKKLKSFFSTNKNKDQEISDTMGMMVSILLYYPEVCNIHFNTKQNILKISFTLLDNTAKEKWLEKKQAIFLALTSFQKLNHYHSKINKLDALGSKDYFKIIFTRDIDSFNLDEINFLVELLQQHFPNMISKDNVQIDVDDLDFSNDFFDFFLNRLKKSKKKNKIIAFREEGKVVIYNK